MMNKLSETSHYACQADAEGSLITISHQWYDEAKEKLAAYEAIGSIREFIALVQANVVRDWVSVKNRLPEEPDKYLIYAAGLYNGYVAAARYTKAGKWQAAQAHAVFEDVTHWRPLPAPPREEEQ